MIFFLPPRRFGDFDSLEACCFAFTLKVSGFTEVDHGGIFEYRFILALQIHLIKMTSRKTASDVHSDLKSHEAKCEERWKTIFKETAEIKQEMNDLNGTLRMAMFGVWRA